MGGRSGELLSIRALLEVQFRLHLDLVKFAKEVVEVDSPVAAICSVVLVDETPISRIAHGC